MFLETQPGSDSVSCLEECELSAMPADVRRPGTHTHVVFPCSPGRRIHAVSETLVLRCCCTGASRVCICTQSRDNVRGGTAANQTESSPPALLELDSVACRKHSLMHLARRKKYTDTLLFLPVPGKPSNHLSFTSRAGLLLARISKVT